MTFETIWNIFKKTRDVLQSVKSFITLFHINVTFPYWELVKISKFRICNNEE